MPGNPKKQHRNATEWNAAATATTANCRQKALLDQRDFLEMEKGHRVCKLVVLKKFDIVYRRIWLNTQTQQIALSKWTSAMDSGCIPGPSSFLPNGFTTLSMGGRTASLSSVSSNGGPQSKTHTLDLLLVREVAILGKLLSCPGSTMQIAEKWRRDGALQRLDPSLVLCIAWGAGFLPVTWLILFDSKEACQLWAQGLGQICAELASAPHALVVERWLRKQFCALLPHSTDTGCLTIKQMKPFVQQRLQYKVTSKQLQEITDSELSFEGFVFANNRLLDFHSLFTSMFAEFTDPQCSQRVQFQQFFDFQRTFQKGDQLGQSREMASDFLRHYLRDVDPDRDLAEPGLSTAEFIDYLYSPENSLFDPLNKEIVHDMTKPLTHYWISSSHNTYLTGDQLKSESSLDAYSRALLMGCRCIELDCWDGAQRRGGPGGEIQVDIVIYHGYTMTSKLALRDVLYTIKQYAFQTSEYPVILSIEDNCSVPAQRQMAVDIQEVLGDLLLTAPVSRDEWQLPSPAALRRKIILKHKKLQNDRQEADAVSLLEDELEQDILSRRCTKKGVLWLKGGPSSGGAGSDWAKHIFVLFNDRLCFLVQPIDQYRGEGSGGNALNGNGQKPLAGRENSLSSQGDENLAAEKAANDAQIGGNADACAEAHITEEWFHGKVDREIAKTRLLEGTKTLKLNGNSSNGLFLVRESSTFIGDFTLSFLHNGAVHHCRIKASIPAGGERKYHLLDTVRKDTLYELISYYTRHSLDTPNFKTFLQIACPQPQPQRDQPWYSEQADTQKAEELLNAVNADGAFLIRHSTGDRTVFVLSLRVDGKSWHYRLKREGRIFVVNQHMFENLCQLVDYYSQNQFVRGVCLKYPVGKYAKCLPQFSSEFGNMDPRFDGYYMELKDLEKEVQAEATREFNGDELAKSVHKNFLNKILTFPMGARITVLQKEGGNPGGEETSTPLWMGRYNNEVGWFPADCVREMTASGVPTSFDDCIVGPGSELNYGTIELVGTKFEKVDSDRANSFHISLAQSHWNVQEYLVAADCPEEMEEWLAACHHQAQQANDKMHQLRTREKQLGIASELSSLVVYCQAVPFNPDFELKDNRFNFYEMCSFSESKHDRLVERGLIRFNQRQLSRVYPQASRLTSANFNPMPMWNNGCHMVAMNFQTGDKAMQLNAGRFMANGRCGFVLKPQYLMDETFRQKSPALESKISKCRACRRLKQQMAASSSQVLMENLEGQRRKSACWEEGVKESKMETFGRIRPPKLSLTTNSSGDFADEELLKSTPRRTSSFPSEEKEECGDNDDCCSCRNDETQNSNNNNNNCQNNQLSNSFPNPYSSTSLLAASNAQFASNCPISLHILVISGRHLSRRGCYDKGGICSPYVEAELLGFAQDAQMQRTNTITSNGLNPIWQEYFLFYVQHPEMCLLRFYIEDGDFVGPKTDPFIGQATFPLDCIRPGFRSIPLLNQFSEPLELSALLVHVEIRHWDPSASTTFNPPVHNRSNSLVPAATGAANSTSNTSSLLLGSGSTVGALLPSSSSTMAPSNPSTSSQSTLPQSIYNVHQLLQLGRSIYSGAQPFNNTMVVNENISRQLNRNTSAQQLAMPSFANGAGALIGGLPSSYGQQMGSGSSRRTSRSTSMESGETTTTNNSTAQMLPLTKRGMGSNTLRKIFRLGRNNN